MDLDQSMLLQCALVPAPDDHCFHRLGRDFENLVGSYRRVGKPASHVTAVLVYLSVLALVVVLLA